MREPAASATTRQKGSDRRLPAAPKSRSTRRVGSIVAVGLTVVVVVVVIAAVLSGGRAD
jgi:hypothetical protein